MDSITYQVEGVSVPDMEKQETKAILEEIQAILKKNYLKENHLEEYFCNEIVSKNML